MSDTDQNDPNEDPLAVDQNGEVQPPPEQATTEVPPPPPNPEGRMTSYAPGHGPNGPFLLDEEAEAEGAQKHADVQAIERVMVLLRWLLEMIEEGKLSP